MNKLQNVIKKQKYHSLFLQVMLKTTIKNSFDDSCLYGIYPPIDKNVCALE
jgi:hypothetical protein